LNEKRVSVRTHLLDVNIRVSDDGGKNWNDVQVKDISDGGLGFTADKEYPRGSELKLRGTVSDFARGLDIECDIKVVFCEKIDDVYNIGAAFRGMGKVLHTELGIFVEMVVTKYPSLLLD